MKGIKTDYLVGALPEKSDSCVSQVCGLDEFDVPCIYDRRVGVRDADDCLACETMGRL